MKYIYYKRELEKIWHRTEIIKETKLCYIIEHGRVYKSTMKLKINSLVTLIVQKETKELKRIYEQQRRLFYFQNAVVPLVQKTKDEAKMKAIMKIMQDDMGTHGLGFYLTICNKMEGKV